MIDECFVLADTQTYRSIDDRPLWLPSLRVRI